MKYIEMTGSPKSANFSTKQAFLNELAQHGFAHSKISKKSNVVSILVCDSPDSGTAKIESAKSLGIEIMTYEELKEAFNLVGDLD